MGTGERRHYFVSTTILPESDDRERRNVWHPPRASGRGDNDRARAGVATTTAAGDCLGDVLADLAARFPDLATTCIDGRQLRPGFTANLDGQRFITDPDTRLEDGDRLLLLSLDAGG